MNLQEYLDSLNWNHTQIGVEADDDMLFYRDLPRDQLSNIEVTNVIYLSANRVYLRCNALNEQYKAECPEGVRVVIDRLIVRGPHA